MLKVSFIKTDPITSITLLLDFFLIVFVMLLLRTMEIHHMFMGELKFVAASGVFLASPFQRGFSLICFLKFNEDEVLLKVLKI